ncbi:UDP-2,3-diacylglucosamine diphosphatase [Kineobactrum salinum]|uniref:UDP-2,3-diacylglucosamine hydrolase n=1 Tax=Kineobactrum salinum TaxID=2708301 RepID=A0A6C0U9H3_9GAMM|nr:UDP-2,3-diacylglucosamine diphosphatase [Kineobactrum salinum]QIB67295.1 UDP-2,3-diacylglucosamine diphosphatase [Kineobactrum salinum]
MPATYFISDLHLEVTRPATVRALRRFLLEHRDCEALYILGDLFELWIGDDDDAPLVGEVAEMLQRFTAAGPALYLMQGNRDFLLGRQFCRRVGGRLLNDPSVINLYGEPTLLMHGDSLCTRDTEYQAFRKNTRTPAWQAELLARSLEDRRKLARELRSMSREATSNKAEDIMDVTPEEVERALLDREVRQLIHGHTHRPARHDHTAGTRWVLGDWDQKGWYLEATPDSMRLVDFDIKSTS